MTSPYYIGDDRSDMRGIKPGWYAIEDDGNLSSGPFPSLGEMHHENYTADDRADGAKVATRAGLNHSLPKSDVEGGVRRSNQNRPLRKLSEDKCHERNHD
jgi:hypothetical protein